MSANSSVIIQQGSQVLIGGGATMNWAGVIEGSGNVQWIEGIHKLPTYMTASLDVLIAVGVETRYEDRCSSMFSCHFSSANPFFLLTPSPVSTQPLIYT